MEKQSPAVEVDRDQLFLWHDDEELEVLEEVTPIAGPRGRRGAGRGTHAVRERLWDVKDVSAFLGVPVATIYQWRVKGGGPPATKMGKHLRFEPEVVRSWVSEHRESP